MKRQSRVETIRRAAAVFVLTSLLSPGLAFFAGPAFGATFPEETPFSQSAFATAKKEGKPILVHITASWCTTCAAQKPIIDKLQSEPKFKQFEIFNVDFDNQKALVRKFDATMQSTLIVYKGAKEVGRSSGETQPAAIKSLLSKAL